MLSWFPAEHAQSSPRLYTNNTKSRRILCDIPSIQIKSADIFSSFCEKFDHHYTKRKPTWFFFILQSIFVWWWTWSSSLRAEQEFYFSLTFSVEIYHWNHALIFEGLFYFHFCGICLYFVLYKSVNVFVQVWMCILL